MGLLSSVFSRSEPAEAAPSETDSVDSVARARSRARQRLLGAVVLVGIGIVGFPLLFETQPRPIPVDVPIEIPGRDSVAPLKLPWGAKDAQVTTKIADSEKPSAPKAVKAEPMITETAADAGSPVRVPRPAPPAEVAERAGEKAADKATDQPAEKPVESKAVEQAESSRARALLEGKVAPKVAASAARYIVQIGAFADPVLARATRAKVERLGLVTYTHVAKTPDGERTRVRVGPVASRDEAEKIAAKIKAAGLPTAILTL